MNEIKAFMIKHNLTKGQFADLMGFTRPAAHHWVLGQREVPEVVLRVMKMIDKYPGLLKEFAA